MRGSGKKCRLALLLAALVADGCGGASSRTPVGKGKSQAGAVSKIGVPEGGCDPTSGALCIPDTAVARRVPGEALPVTMRQWIVFAAAGDSLEISVPKGGVVSTNFGVERDSSHDNVPYFHHRMKTSGLIVVTVMLDLDNSLNDSVEYSLRLKRNRHDSDGTLGPMGRTATLVVASPNENDRFRLAPLSGATRADHSGDWMVPAGIYRVVLAPDSLYQLCRLPCAHADTIRLVGGTYIERSPR